MNDEIKEILDYFRYIVNDKKETYTVVSKDTIYLEQLLDYITNLQKTNKNHSKKLIELGDKITNLQQENERLNMKYKSQKAINQKLLSINIKHNRELEIYKSRCEKASDKLGNYKHYSTPTEEQNSENEDIVDSALNILQNGSESK